MSPTPAHRKLIAKSINKSAKKVIVESGINASTRSGNKALDHLAKRLAEQPFSSLTAAVKVGEELGQRIVALSQKLDRQSLDQGIIRQLVFQKQLPTADLSIADPKLIAVQSQPSHQPAALTTQPKIEPEEKAATGLIHPETAAVEELAEEAASASEWEDEATQEILVVDNSVDDDELDDELDENPEDDDLDDDELADDELDENPEASQSLTSVSDKTDEQDISVAESIEQAENSNWVTSEMTLEMDNENETIDGEIEDELEDSLEDSSVDEVEDTDLEVISESAADIDDEAKPEPQDEQEILPVKI